MSRTRSSSAFLRSSRLSSLDVLAKTSQAAHGSASSDGGCHEGKRLARSSFAYIRCSLLR